MSVLHRDGAAQQTRRTRSVHDLVLSVIVPVYQGAEHLGRVLAALTQSNLARATWELLVVDDASTDGSADIAAGHADLLVRLAGAPRGPAYARNRGFELSRGLVVAFVDADVLVHPDALSRMLEAIGQDAAVGAVMGAYAGAPKSGRLVSDYRNLLRHVQHQRSAGDTDGFSAGLAAVRRDAFMRSGMFDEWRFPRPQAEAIELGDRLRLAGYRIVRRLDVQGTHLKRWTLREWIGVDLLDRGMSLARLHRLADGRARADKLYLATPVDAVVAWVGMSSSALGLWRGSAPLLLLACACLLLLVLHNAQLFAAFARARGPAFAVAAIPLHSVTCALYGVASAAGRTLYHAVGEPEPDPVTQAFAEVGVETWPPIPAPRGSIRVLSSHSHSNGTGNHVAGP